MASSKYCVFEERSQALSWGGAHWRGADRLAWHLRQRSSMHADETPVPQLDPGNGKTKKAYLWAYRSNDLQPGSKIIVFDYQAGRGGRYAQQFLQDWHGPLLVDDYGGYKALFAAARAHSLRRNRRITNRQQPGGKLYPPDCPGQKLCSVSYYAENLSEVGSA